MGLKAGFDKGSLLAAFLLVLSLAGRVQGRPPRHVDVCIQGQQKGLMYLLEEECSGDDCNDERRCTPKTSDAVGYALFECMQDLQVRVTGCDVQVLTTTKTSTDGMPCAFLHLAGNLTGTQSAAVLAHADPQGFLEYFAARPKLVMEFGHANAASLVRDIWAFLHEFFVDSRFSGVHLESAISQLHITPLKTDEVQPMDDDSRDIEVVALSSARRLSQAEPHTDSTLEEVEQGFEAAEAGLEVHEQGLEEQDDERSLTAEFDAAEALQRHGRRPAAATLLTRRHNKIRLTRPQGCKHRFKVHHSNPVLTPEAPPPAPEEVAWMAVYLSFACASVIFTVIGLSACLHFQRSHAEYLASHHDLVYIKQQLEKAPTSLAAAMPALFQPIGPAPVPVSAAPARAASAPAAAPAVPLAHDKAIPAFGVVEAAAAAAPAGLEAVAEAVEAAAPGEEILVSASSAPLIDLSSPADGEVAKMV